MNSARPFTDAEFEIIDRGDGYEAETIGARVGGLGGPHAGLGVPPGAVIQILARLGSGILRGHEADALGTAAILGGYVKSPERMRAVIERGEPQINAFLQEIDLAAVINAALEPTVGLAPGDTVRAAAPALALGALGGFLFTKLFGADDTE